MVRKHEEFMTAGHDFMSWLKVISDRLDKVTTEGGNGSADPSSSTLTSSSTEKDFASSKLTNLKILESDNETGREKLEYALKKANEACAIALDDDRYIVEEEVAFLHDEYDKFNEKLAKSKRSLERTIVQWKDYKEMYDGCLRNLDKCKSLVEGAKELKPTIEVKKVAVEKFGLELQRILDWQKRLESLNQKAQSLSGGGSSGQTKITSDMAHIFKGYENLQTNAKVVMKKLEQNYQEHHQLNSHIQECNNLAAAIQDHIATGLACDDEGSHGSSERSAGVGSTLCRWRVLCRTPRC